MKDKTKEKKSKSKVRKVLEWVFYGIFGVLFVSVLTFQIVGLASKKNNYGVPRFGNMQLTLVLTDSMEPDYEVNTLLIVTKTNASNLKVGDDVTFYYEPWKSNFTNPIVTHRIREIQVNEDVEEGKGKYTYIVGGINRNSKNSPDGEAGGGDCLKQKQIINETVVLGKVTGHSKFLGGLYLFISSIWGLLILLIIPALYIMITSGIDLVKALKEPEDEEVKTVSSVSSLSKKDKERLKKQMIDEMMKGKEHEKE